MPLSYQLLEENGGLFQIEELLTTWSACETVTLLKFDKFLNAICLFKFLVQNSGIIKFLNDNHCHF